MDDVDDVDEGHQADKKRRQNTHHAESKSDQSAGYPKINLFTKWDEVNEMFQDKPDWKNSDELDRIM